jgi:hypothetical protein
VEEAGAAILSETDNDISSIVNHLSRKILAQMEAWT